MLLEYIHWNVNPEIINLFGISIRYYGLLFVGGLVLSLSILSRIFKQQNIPVTYLDLLSIYGMVGIFLGARIVHCFFYEGAYYLAHPLEILLPIQSTIDGGYEFSGYHGLASHGGVIGMAVALWVYTIKTKQPILLTMGLLGIVAPLSACFIRLANLMNSEIVGEPTNVAWAFVFEQIDLVPRHPTQLYEAICYFLVFLLLIVLYSKKKLSISPSFYFGVSMFLVFGARFFIEFLKEVQVGFEESWVLNMGQWLSIPFVLAGVFFMLYANKIKAKNNVAD